MGQKNAGRCGVDRAYDKDPELVFCGVHAQGVELHAKATATIEQANLSGSKVQAQPMPLPPPFPEPPPPKFVFLPEAPEQRVYAVWLRLLPDVNEGLTLAKEALKLEGENPRSEQLILLDALMKFRAVIEGYRLQASKQMMAQLPPPGEEPQGGPSA